MPDKLPVAVIGTGTMGKNHVRTYHAMPETQLIGIADPDETVGKALAEEYHVPWFATYEELIEKQRPQAVSVCVPTSLHRKIGIDCLQRELHVLLEKPIAGTIEDAEAILAEAEKQKRVLMVGHIERHNPAVQKVKDLLADGKLGNITAIMARRVGGFPPQIRDANIAVDLAIHDIDIVNYLLDELPNEIAVHHRSNHIEQRSDAVEFFLQYNAASAYVQANWISPVKIRKLNITGSEGYLEMDYISQQIDFYQSKYQKVKIEAKDYSDYILRFSDPDSMVINVAKKQPLQEELLAFIKAIQGEQTIDSQFAVDALRIALHS